MKIRYYTNPTTKKREIWIYKDNEMELRRLHPFGDDICFRAFAFLLRNGIHSKEEAMIAMTEKRWMPANGHRGYGKKTHSDLKKWLGIEDQSNCMVKCPHCGKFIR